MLTDDDRNFIEELAKALSLCEPAADILRSFAEKAEETDDLKNLLISHLIDNPQDTGDIQDRLLLLIPMIDLRSILPAIANRVGDAISKKSITDQAFLAVQAYVSITGQMHDRGLTSEIFRENDGPELEEFRF